MTQSTLGCLHRLQVVEYGVKFTLKVVHFYKTVLLLLSITILVVSIAILVSCITLSLRLKLLSSTVNAAVTRTNGSVVVEDRVCVRVGVLFVVAAT